MEKIKPSCPGKIITGLIFNDPKIFDKTKILLSRKLGLIDLESGLFLFSHTHYYNREMGNGLQRKFLSFRNLKSCEDIYKLKIFTDKLEKRLSILGRRQINIDPGYLTLSKLILLTTKNYSHRIYLKRGIYSEITLFFKDKSYRPWGWTYPDYKTKEYIDFFNSVREIYLKDLKQEGFLC